jgi:DNA-binding MarR family transcriptional regulator
MKNQSIKTTETTFTLINQVVDLWNIKTLLILKKHNLSHPEFTMLASAHYMCNVTKNATQIDICTHAGIKQMNASILLRKLQTRKFLSRKEHPIDTRAKTVHLTPLGEQTATKILNEIEVINKHFFQLTTSNETAFANKLQEIRDANSKN